MIYLEVMFLSRTIIFRVSSYPIHPLRIWAWGTFSDGETPTILMVTPNKTNSNWCEAFSDTSHTHSLQETYISPQNGILKIIFLFPRWDMLIPWRVTSLIPKMLLLIQIPAFRQIRSSALGFPKTDSLKPREVQLSSVAYLSGSSNGPDL